MNWLLVIIFSVIYPLVHIANGWIFSFVEISPHISLIYLPAFLRLANVLILGRRHGSLATLLGGLLLMWYSAKEICLPGSTFCVRQVGLCWHCSCSNCMSGEMSN